MSEWIHMSSQLSFWTVPLPQCKAKERNTAFVVELMAATSSEGEGKPIRCKGILHSFIHASSKYIHICFFFHLFLLLFFNFWSFCFDHCNTICSGGCKKTWWVTGDWRDHGGTTNATWSSDPYHMFLYLPHRSHFFRHAGFFLYSFINQ